MALGNAIDAMPIAEERGAQLRGVQVTYTRQGDALTVLDVPTWEVDGGEQLAIYGPSGSGKSTLLHLLSGMVAPTRGEITVCGEDLSPMTEAERDRFRARRIGYVFQNFNLLHGYTALENVLMGATFTPTKARRDVALALLERVGLGAKAHRTPRELSFGEQQRVAIARALLKKPPFVLADEPTGSLDPRNAEKIVALLRETCAAQESALILVTHDPNVVTQFENRLPFAELNRAWSQDEMAEASA